MTEFDDLIQLALDQQFSGWDFSFVDTRLIQEDLPWSYPDLARDLMRTANTMLDMGTGGGELLSTLLPLPKRTIATEAYLPNVPIAARHLREFNVPVVAVVDDESRLPFEENTYDLIINRHESYSPGELKRILKPGGRFLTQQVGGKDQILLNEFLQDEVYFEYSYWDQAYALKQLREQGFRVLRTGEYFPEMSYKDIAAIVFYLKVIEWQIEDFSLEKYLPKLRQMHACIEEKGKFESFSHRFYLEVVLD